MPGWQPAGHVVGVGAGALLALLVLGAVCTRRALSRADAGEPATAWRAGASVANLMALLTLVALALWQLPDPTRHAADAVRAAIVAYVGLHTALALLFSAFALDETRQGKPGAGALRNLDAWQSYTLVVTGLAMGAIWVQGMAQ